jgi:Tol biopolymer transport system component
MSLKPAIRLTVAAFWNPAYSHVFVVPAEGGTPRQLTQGNFNHRSQLSWTPDSEEILFSANRNENWALQSREADLFAVTLAGELRQITSEPGVETAPQVSPDGRLIAYGKTDNAKLAYRNRYLYVIGVDGSGDRNLSADIDNSLSDWSWDGNSALYYQVTNRGVTEVARVSLDGGHQTISLWHGRRISRPALYQWLLRGSIESCGGNQRLGHPSGRLVRYPQS